VRGLAGPRVLVLTNGVGMIDASTLSPDHQVAVDPAEAQRIEVLRGPSALLYGGSAIGGVVNILDERVPTSPATGVDGRVSAQLSSVDDGRQGSVQLKFGEGPWVVAFDALRRETDDYAVPVAPESRRLAASEGEEPEPADRVENSAVALTTYGAGVSYVAARGFAGVSVKRTETSYGVPGHGHEGEDGEDGEEDHGDTTIDLEQTRFDLRGEADVDLGPFSRARGTLGVADYEHVELEGDEVGTRFTSDGFEGRFELVQRKRGGWSGAVGVQGLQRSLTALGEEAYVPSTDIREVGVFTAQRVDLDAWGFEGGLRFDRRTLESDAGDREFDNVSASVGMFARPVNGAFVGVSLSRNERAPTEAELFAFGEHAATRSFEVGDAGLDSEVAYSVEIAGHYENGPFEADLHLFSARYEGFIDLRATGDENDGVPVFAYRAVDADFRGFEGEASLEMWRSGERELRLETGFDFVRGETDQGPPARIPSWSLTARVVYETPQLESRLEVRRVGDQNRVAEFELPTEGYVLTNLFAAYKPPAVEGLVLFAEARNLFDEEAREHASFLKDLAPLPGRNLRAGLAYRF
jgi:iron complex outermembrane receptor protein